jgi:hypothetical protein
MQKTRFGNLAAMMAPVLLFLSGDAFSANVIDSRPFPGALLPMG